ARQIVGAYDDPVKLAELAQAADVVTFDFENVPAQAIRELSNRVKVFPSADALATSQDRCLEKELFNRLDIPTTRFCCVDTPAELQQAVKQIGLPAVLKTRRLGYDGKGQKVLHSTADIEPAWQAVNGSPCVLEEFIAFDREVSLIAVRSRSGEIAFYPLVHNMHLNGILHISRAPYANKKLQRQAEQYLTPILQQFDYVGVLAVEFFVRDKQLIANEMAPRVHNTGHWTIEGAGVSQFENHLRAITGLPLGTTEAHSHAAMINFISTLPPVEKILGIPGCHYHDYGKAPRPGRKLGHATLRASSAGKLQRKIDAILAILKD
ncbi:MAG TPA: 5-(carboxyamino)imidazole ribonucleotide synthase, partial [Gammaproteobacteria bacterium]